MDLCFSTRLESKTLSLIIRLLKICWFILAILIILIAVLFGGLKAATPILEKHQQQIIERINHNIQQRISIGHVSVAWYHLSPVIELEQLAVFTDTAQTVPVLNTQKVYIAINLVKLAQHFQVVPTKIILVQATLNLPPMAFPLSSVDQTGIVLPPKLLALQEIGAKSLLIHANLDGKPINVMTDLSIQKQSGHYNIQGDFSFGAEKLQSIFAATLKLNKQNLTQSSVKLYVESDNLNLTKVQTYLPTVKLPVQGDIATMQAWLVLRNQNIDYAAISLLGENLSVTEKQFHLLQAVPYLEGTFIYQRLKTHRELAINALKFDPDAAGFDALITQNAKNTIAITGHNLPLNYNRLRQFMDVSSLHIPGVFSEIKPKVLLSDLHVQFDLLDNDQVANYQAAINFADLSCKPSQKIPGITNLAGKVNMRQTANGLSMYTKLYFDDSVLNMPWLFRKPIPIANGQARLSAEQLPEQRWAIQGHDIKLNLPDAHAVAALKLFIGGTVPARLELLANVSTNHFSRDSIYKYLPYSIMPDKVTQWLDQSLQTVGQLNARLILRGDIDQFPFDHNEGLFLIDADINNTQLKFYPGWPAVEQLAGNLVFKNRGMDISVASAKTQDVTIARTKAIIPVMSADDPVILQINASASGAVPDGLNYYLHSPLAADTAVLKQLRTDGKFALDLALTIPIANIANDAVNAQGMAKISNASVGYQTKPLTLNQLTGTVKFNNLDINSEKIQGFLGKKPISLQIKTLKEADNDMATQIDLTGEFSIDEINAHLPQALPGFITGASAATSSLIFDHDDGLSIALQSDLNGIAINLPAPLGKPATQASQFTVMLNDNDQTTRQIVAQYQKILLANVFFKLTKGNMQFTSGVVSIGNKMPFVEAPDMGLDININLPSLNVDEWKAFLAQSGNNTRMTNQISLNQLAVSLSQVKLFGYTLNQLTLLVKPYATLYTMDISSKEINGKITLPKVVNSNNPIKANLDSLTLTTSPSGKQASVTTTQVTPYFNVDFACQNVKVNQMQFGKIAASLRTSAKGFDVTGLTMGSVNYRLMANLNWQAANNRTSGSGNLKITNAAKMLTSLGLPGNFNTNNGNINFNLNWQGLPFVPDLPSLNGNLSLLVSQGSITGLSKSTNAKVGLGNLLTVLSLQNLPGRLQRGMSGNTKQGFNFDKMQGDLSITNGNLQTQNAALDGAVAYIGIRGRIGLATKDFDLIMTIVPHLTSSLPVVATIAGGPIAGAVTWVVNKAIGPEVNKISKYTYTIKGSWSNPIVTPQNRQ